MPSPIAFEICKFESTLVHEINPMAYRFQKSISLTKDGQLRCFTAILLDQYACTIIYPYISNALVPALL